MRFLLSCLKNKYFLVTVIFLVWIFFFAQYDILSQLDQQKELKEMKYKINYLEQEVNRLRAERKALLEDPKVKEKYAREKYFMKRKNEDVYVFDTLKSAVSIEH